MTKKRHSSIEEEMVRDISTGLIVLIESVQEDPFKTTINVIKALTGRGYFAVVLSIPKSASALIKEYKKHKINLSHVFFIDALSREKDGEHMILIPSLSDLNAITTAFDITCSNLEKENDFFYINSIQSLLEEKDPSSVTRSLHAIFSKMRLYGVGGIVLSAKGINKQTRAEIVQLCDKVEIQ